MGVIPLVLSTGAGSEMRRAIGVAVFLGCWRQRVWLGADPVFYVLVQRLVEGRENKKVAGSADLSPATSVEHSRADTLSKKTSRCSSCAGKWMRGGSALQPPQPAAVKYHAAERTGNEAPFDSRW